MELASAVEVFAKGFAYTRSFTHPYLVVREGPLTILRDAPRRSGDTRTEEIIVCGISPDEAASLLRDYGDRRYKVCVVHRPDDDFDRIRAEYKSRGFRARGQEPFFVRDLDTVPDPDERIRRVLTEEEAERVRKASGTRQIVDGHFEIDDAPLRLFAASHENEVVGWVRSIRVGDAAWVSNLYVQPEHRRSGLGRGLMATMLADDQRLGVRHSVLLASLTGAKLYPLLGYRQIGTLQIFAPVRA